MDEELRAFLLQFPGVTAEIGARAYPAPLPQGATLPALAYTDVSDVGDHTGPDGAGAYRQARYQLDQWAETRTGATRLAETVRCVLDGYRGAWGSASIGGVFCKNTFTRQDPETGLWRAISDYVIHVTGR